MNKVEKMKELIKGASIEQINKFYNMLGDKQKEVYAAIIVEVMQEMFLKETN